MYSHSKRLTKKSDHKLIHSLLTELLTEVCNNYPTLRTSGAPLHVLSLTHQQDSSYVDNNLLWIGSFIYIKQQQNNNNQKTKTTTTKYKFSKKNKYICNSSCTYEKVHLITLALSQEKNDKKS